jgi:hypothetical protein
MEVISCCIGGTTALCSDSSDVLVGTLDALMIKASSYGGDCMLYWEALSRKFRLLVLC